MKAVSSEEHPSRCSNSRSRRDDPPEAIIPPEGKSLPLSPKGSDFNQKEEGLAQEGFGVTRGALWKP